MHIQLGALCVHAHMNEERENSLKTFPDIVEYSLKQNCPQLGLTLVICKAPSEADAVGPGSHCKKPAQRIN